MTNLSLERISRRFLALAATLLLGPASALAQTPSAPTPAAARLSGTKAIQIARDYCREIGQTVTIPGQAIFPTPPDTMGEHYWQKRWQVKFFNQATVEVVDATGVIADYDNLAYFARHDYSPAGQAISQEEAMKIAQKAVDATGQHEQLHLLFANLEQSHPNPPLANSHNWFIEWDRTFRGIPYYHQHAALFLNAETGEIMSFTLMYPSPPLTQSIVATTQDQAILNTQAHLIYDRGFQGEAYLGPVSLRVVRPNGGWSHFQDRPGQSLGTRVAWVVSYHWRTLYSGAKFGATYDTWIDAQTGEVLGGDGVAGSFGSSTAADTPVALTPLTEALKAVSRVYVRRRDPSAKAGWSAAPSLAFGDKDQPASIALVATTSQTVTDTPTGTAPYQLALLGKDNSLRVYSYYPDTGLLGEGADWVSVPVAFKTWMQKRIAAAPAPPKK